MGAKAKGYWLWILLLLAMEAQSETLHEIKFRALPSVNARIAYLNQEFSPVDRPAYGKLLSIIESKEDRQSTLFWHYRYYVLADSFGLSVQEQRAQLNIMHEKALQYEDRIAVIASEIYLLIMQHKEKKISTIQLYKRFLPFWEEMQKLGFEKFLLYDLNVIITYSVADLANYWGSQPANSLKHLKIAERYISPSALSKYYNILTINGLFNAYYQQHDLPNFYKYGWKLYHLNSKDSADKQLAPWISGYWQAYALSQMAIISNEHKLPVSYKLVKDAWSIYQTVRISNDALPHLREEVRVLDVLTVALINLNFLDEAAPLLQRLGVVVKLLRRAGEENAEAEWGWCRDKEKYYEKLGDYKKALYAKREGDAYYARLYKRNSLHELDRVREENKVETYVDKLEIANQLRRRQQYITLLVIGLMVVFALIAYAIYRRIDRDKKLITHQKAVLEESLIEKETLIKEVHHRVKNNLQIISGLLEKQAIKTSDETTRKLLREGQNRVFSMALVHQNLYKSENLSAIDLQHYFSALVHHIQQSQQQPQHHILLEMEVADVKLSVDTAVPLGLILNELLTNSYKYAFQGLEQGRIIISFQPLGNGYKFVVKDNGLGIPPEVDWRNSRSLGLNLVNGLVRQLAGTLELKSEQDSGTCITMSIS